MMISIPAGIAQIRAMGTASQPVVSNPIQIAPPQLFSTSRQIEKNSPDEYWSRDASQDGEEITPQDDQAAIENGAHV
jgi:hypothetical protein